MTDNSEMSGLDASMPNKVLVAFTPTKYQGHYPPYINVSLNAGVVVVTVRGPVKDGREGETVSIGMTPTQFSDCFGAIAQVDRVQALIEAANICGTLAETTYDSSDAFEAATGCEAAIRALAKEK